MENATKALLIAAAVLIAIVIIAGGIFLLNSGVNSKDNVDEVGQEIKSTSQGVIENIQTGLSSIGNVKCSSCGGTGVIKKLVCNNCSSDDVKIIGSGHESGCEHKGTHYNCIPLKSSPTTEWSIVGGTEVKYCDCQSAIQMCRSKCNSCNQYRKLEEKSFDCPNC